MYLSKINSIIYSTVLSIILISCTKQETKPDREYTYFGGEIVNPNTDYVVLSKGDTYGDTIFLDKKNKFLHKIEDLKEGIYSFKHSPETQIVILEKGDSVLVRLNTLEFDESLFFTADGAKKNNFLIDMYLQNEMERKNLDKNDFRLTPKKFKQKQDSLLRLREKKFNVLLGKNKLSDLAKEICESSYQYDFYSRFEMYYYRYQYSGLHRIESYKEVPSSFFEYREELDFNNDKLKRLFSYNRFLNHYFSNNSYTNYNARHTSRHTISQLNLIDSTIQHSYIKNNLLRSITINFMLDNKNDYTSENVLNHYIDISSNSLYQKELKKLSNAISRLKPSNLIPDQELISSTGETTTLSALFKKPVTALYFWSTERKEHYIKAHKKASYLSSIYPEIDFVGINTDDEQTTNWLKTIKRHNYDLNKEYEFKFPKCSSEELVIHYTNKVILVNQEGKIINPNADLFSYTFENQLMNYTQLANLKH